MVPKGNDSSTSTTWERRLVKIVRPPEGQGAPGAVRRLRWLSLPRRHWGQPLHMTMHYRGGAEARVEVRCRGQAWAYSGDTAILDVLYDVNSRGRR